MTTNLSKDSDLQEAVEVATSVFSAIYFNDGAWPDESLEDQMRRAMRAALISIEYKAIAVQTAQAISDEALVDVARKTGLRGYLIGVNAQHAHEILRRFVNELALYAAPPTQAIAVEADIYKQRYEFIKTMPKEMLLFWRGAYGCDDGALDAAMNNPDHVSTMSATAPSQGAKQ